jgi:hypothetical protein
VQSDFAISGFEGVVTSGLVDNSLGISRIDGLLVCSREVAHHDRDLGFTFPVGFGRDVLDEILRATKLAVVQENKNYVESGGSLISIHTSEVLNGHGLYLQGLTKLAQPNSRDLVHLYVVRNEFASVGVSNPNSIVE